MGGLSKKGGGGLGQLADLRGGLERKKGVVFLRKGRLIPQCTLCKFSVLLNYAFMIWLYFEF